MPSTCPKRSVCCRQPQRSGTPATRIRLGHQGLGSHHICGWRSRIQEYLQLAWDRVTAPQPFLGLLGLVPALTAAAGGQRALLLATKCGQCTTLVRPFDLCRSVCSWRHYSLLCSHDSSAGWHRDAGGTITEKIGLTGIIDFCRIEAAK